MSPRRDRVLRHPMALFAARTSIRSSRSSQNSRHFSEKPKSAPSTAWRRKGGLLDAFPPGECANYLQNAGYASIQIRKALVCPVETHMEPHEQDGHRKPIATDARVRPVAPGDSVRLKAFYRFL